MATHPEVQDQARREIDAVIGTNRLPEFEDRPSLPYLEAVYREVMRWKPVLPLGVPHATTDADIFEGYFIPQGESHLFLLRRNFVVTRRLGATVISNIWWGCFTSRSSPNQRYQGP